MGDDGWPPGGGGTFLEPPFPKPPLLVIECRFLAVGVVGRGTSHEEQRGSFQVIGGRRKSRRRGLRQSPRAEIKVGRPLPRFLGKLGPSAPLLRLCSGESVDRVRT
jgi:hypothetical protein